jgi:hypothetical protein
MGNRAGSVIESAEACQQLFPGCVPVLATVDGARELVFARGGVRFTIRDVDTRSYSVQSRARFRGHVICKTFTGHCNNFTPDAIDKSCTYRHHSAEVSVYGKCGACVVRRAAPTVLDEWRLYCGMPRETRAATAARIEVLARRVSADYIHSSQSRPRPLSA